MPMPTTQNADPAVLSLRRVFGAPQSAVFRAFTEPGKLARWWGPEGFSLPEYEMDVRPGGRYRFVMQAPDGQRFHLSGVYEEVVPDHRLVFSWKWDHAEEDTRVTLLFNPVGGATELILVQERFGTVESRDSHQAGWTSSFESLARALATASIHHEITVGAPPERVYEAITTQSGLASFWTADTEASTELGGTRVRFTHGGWRSAEGWLPMCCTTWAFVLDRLKRYAETGRPDPYFSGKA